jgi:NADPH2 dehydrogenase
MAPRFHRIPGYPSAAALADYLRGQGAELPVAAEPAPEAFARPLRVGGRRVGNRLCVQPMEGWDGTPDGRPSEFTLRRWRRFGQSGAKLIWGGEAVAVRPDGRANPNQLCLTPDTVGDLASLLRALRAEHGPADDLLVGLQLTHSGRYSRPTRKDRPEPRIAFHHPLLDRRVGIAPDDDAPVFSDAELDELLGDFARAARLAEAAGFDFVDIKHCHGYLLHELLAARTRPGRYGGDFEGRTRFLREVVAAVRREAPGLLIGVRLSAFDLVPFRRGADGTGEPEPCPLPYVYGFGVRADRPTEPDLDEPRRLLRLLRDLGVALVNLTAGSPYSTPHIQRPAQYPPSDGYAPPEDPLLGVARQIRVVRELKAEVPDLPVVGSGYSYLQEYLPHVAAGVLGAGWADAVGLGRAILAYPELPREMLEGRRPDRRRLCRTFSDCTTAPRNGMRSGCYPLDPHYRAQPEWRALQALKREAASAGP